MNRKLVKLLKVLAWAGMTFALSAIGYCALDYLFPLIMIGQLSLGGLITIIVFSIYIGWHEEIDGWIMRKLRGIWKWARAIRN